MRDKRGKVIGVMGITRRDEDRMRQHDVREVTVAVQYAREHCHEVVTTAELARAAGVSEHMPGVFFFMKDDQGWHIAGVEPGVIWF